MSDGSYEHEIRIAPGFIKEEGENAQYGQHCMEMMFICKNGKGAVVLQVMTGWYPFSGVIGESSFYNVRMAWHLPVPTNPLDRGDGPIHDCDIIKQKCVGSSISDHNGRWMKLLCYSTQDHFRKMLEHFHKHVTSDEPMVWEEPNMLYLSQRKSHEDSGNDIVG